MGRVYGNCISLIFPTNIKTAPPQKIKSINLKKKMAKKKKCKAEIYLKLPTLMVYISLL